MSGVDRYGNWKYRFGVAYHGIAFIVTDLYSLSLQIHEEGCQEIKTLSTTLPG